jgi:hypothetical protein
MMALDLSRRLREDGRATELEDELRAMVSGDHPLVATVAPPLQRLVRTHLRMMAEHLPPN